VTDFHVYSQFYPGYSEADLTLFGEFAQVAPHPEPGFVTDFLGTKIRASSLWKEARKLDGQICGVPVPGDFHAEAIEWIGVLKAACSARGQYVAMELGAGFGTWSVAGGLAARHQGITDIRLVAVEADPNHCANMRLHFGDNEFDPGRHRLFEAAVGVTAGQARWPVMSSSTEEWGLRPMQDNVDYTGRVFRATRLVNVTPIGSLLALEPRWDLVHFDVQGSEFDLCRACIDDLNTRVHWIIVGTHSRKIEGDLLALMFKSGWLLEHEKPSKFIFRTDAPTLEAMTTLDGTQVWRNPRLD
jgi:FkbM family methyltransferase